MKKDSITRLNEGDDSCVSVYVWNDQVIQDSIIRNVLLNLDTISVLFADTRITVIGSKVSLPIFKRS